MGKVDVVVAGTGFQALRAHLASALPEVQLHMLEPEVIARGGISAQILIPAMSRIDAALMDKVDGLRLIQQWGAGLEGVDIAAASQRGIAVSNVPTDESGNAESVAEWCVMAAIAISRRLPELEQGIREGAAWGGPSGRALLGRTATIIGLGGIGKALIERLRPFGMRLLGIRGHPDAASARRLGLDWLGGTGELEQALGKSDYVFLCLPLNDDTRGLISERTLGLMPESAYIINPGRGALVSEQALLAALSEGRLAGAALDVFEQEPLAPESPLLASERVLATPHIAGVTDVSYEGIAARVAENVHLVLSGRQPRHCANPEAVPQAPG